MAGYRGEFCPDRNLLTTRYPARKKIHGGALIGAQVERKYELVLVVAIATKRGKQHASRQCTDSNVRTKLGWSQLDLATRADLAVRTVQFAESGLNPSRRRSFRISLLPWPGVRSRLSPRRRSGDGRGRDVALVAVSLHSIAHGTSGRSVCENEHELRDAVRQMRSSWKQHLQISVGSESTAVETIQRCRFESHV